MFQRKLTSNEQPAKIRRNFIQHSSRLKLLQQHMDSKLTTTSEQLSDIVKNRDATHAELSIEDLVQKLHTDIHHGLSADPKDIANRQQYFGSNRLDARRSKTFFEFFFDALKDETLIILMVASVISIVLGVIFPPKGESRGYACMKVGK